MVSQETVVSGTAHVKGTAVGTLVASDVELSFWGGVNSQTGEIIDRHHPLSGQYLQDTILAIRGGRGSCSGSGVMLELLLNNKGPRALLLERRDDILILGVMVAEELFASAIPVVTLNPSDFSAVMKLKGNVSHVEFDRVSSRPSNGVRQHDQPSRVPGTVTLSAMDQDLFAGVYGKASQIAIRIVLRMAELIGAQTLMDVTQAHIDCCVYTGEGSLLFAEKLLELGGKVRVPTTLNSVSVDQNRWRIQGVDPIFGEAAARLASVYVEMGSRPTFTCAPYQLDSVPKRGEQVAWAESNAVVYANSVLGARTMKYPDFLDACIALTGRAPAGGAHLETNRLASLVVSVCGVDAMDDSFYPVLGYHVGSLAPDCIPVVTGVEDLSPSNDDLKAFSAAFATISSAPMFHMAGITPEARGSLETIVQKEPPVRTVTAKLEGLRKCWHELDSAPRDLPVDLVSLGNPHFSFKEIKRLAELCRGHEKMPTVSVVVTCGRSSYSLAQQAGLVTELEAFGVQFITDTCWCMLGEPTIPVSPNAIMTNSGKYAHYGPGLTGRKFFFGSLAMCVEATCLGHSVQRPRWLGIE